MRYNFPSDVLFKFLSDRQGVCKHIDPENSNFPALVSSKQNGSICFLCLNWPHAAEATAAQLLPDSAHRPAKVVSIASREVKQ
jgi:hypothetical protein